MKNFVLRYGIYAGLFLGGFALIENFFFQDALTDPNIGMLVGYSSMLVGFTFIYAGVKKYRDSLGDKGLSFGRAFGAGLLIMAIACLFYTLAWTVYAFVIDPEWIPRYMDMHEQHILTDSDLTPAERAEDIAEMKEWAPIMKSPWLFALFGYTEPFLPGILISLISAFALKRKAA